jgi:hypothetical protein
LPQLPRSFDVVTFVASTATLEKAKPLLSESWKPEELAGKRRYILCPDVSLNQNSPAFGRVTGTGHHAELGHRAQAACRSGPD